MNSPKEQDILDRVKYWYEYSVTSEQYTAWKHKAKESFAFYDGYQWTQAEIATLQDRKQPIITMNQIAPKVDSVSGVEQTSRTIISYKPRTYQMEDAEMAQAFTAIALNWQEREDVAYKNSEAFKNMLISGLGWVQATRDQSGFFQYDIVDPYEMVWDIDDRSPDLSNQRFVCRARFLDYDELLLAYPDKEEYITELMRSSNNKDEGVKTRTAFNLGQSKGAAIESYMSEQGGKMLVVEVQYREKEKFYSYIDNNERAKSVLDKDVAEENKLEGTEVEELFRFTTKFAHYTADVLLTSGTLSEQDENFELVPMVFRREKESGMPYGIVERGKDAQREHNKRRSKMMHLLNTNQILIDEKVSDVQDYDRLKQEAAAPDGIIDGVGIKLNNNLDLAQGQLAVYNQTNNELQSVMGVFDESMGQQTNATSGLAIQQRQGATLRTQSTSFDQFRHFKKRLGRKFMGMIQDIDDANLLVQITGEDGEDVSIILNEAYEVDGKTVYARDVSTANFDIYVEETPDYDAPPAETAERVTQILMNGQGAMLANPDLLKLIGVRNADKIAAVLAQQPSPEQQDGEAQPDGA